MRQNAIFFSSACFHLKCIFSVRHIIRYLLQWQEVSLERKNWLLPILTMRCEIIKEAEAMNLLKLATLESYLIVIYFSGYSKHKKPFLDIKIPPFFNKMVYNYIHNVLHRKTFWGPYLLPQMVIADLKRWMAERQFVYLRVA